MSSHNLIYIVTDRYDRYNRYDSAQGHIVMIGPEQFVHWLQNNIAQFYEDTRTMRLVNALIAELESQASGRATYNSVVAIAIQMELFVTVIAGTRLTD